MCPHCTNNWGSDRVNVGTLVITEYDRPPPPPDLVLSETHMLTLTVTVAQDRGVFELRVTHRGKSRVAYFSGRDAATAFCQGITEACSALGTPYDAVGLHLLGLHVGRDL